MTMKYTNKGFKSLTVKITAPAEIIEKIAAELDLIAEKYGLPRHRIERIEK